MFWGIVCPPSSMFERFTYPIFLITPYAVVLSLVTLLVFVAWNILRKEQILDKRVKISITVFMVSVVVMIIAAFNLESCSILF